MTKFCHIAPTDFLSSSMRDSGAHLILAHLAEEDDTYAQAFKSDTTKIKILDNSAFEMYKRGLPMYPSDKLIDIGKKVGADYVVMSDYPNEPSWKTIEAAKELAPKFRAAGFGTFFVPQSRQGDPDDYFRAFHWAAESSIVDYIGVSILAAPLAFNAEKGNNLQRFLSRWHTMRLLEERGILDMITRAGKKIHFLGMVDGPNEISLVSEFLYMIDTWDSSAAYWYAINGIAFDRSPTGSHTGKFEKEVDFSWKRSTRRFIRVGLDLAHADATGDHEEILIWHNVEHINKQLNFNHPYYPLTSNLGA